MARGVNFSNTYSLGEVQAGSGFCQGNGPTDISLAQFVLQQFDIPVENAPFPGKPLHGYDVKSMDALQVLKLALLAESDGANFTEVYATGQGTVRPVVVGESAGSIGGVGILLHTSQITNTQPRIDHVVARARADLPTRTHGGTVDVMGAGIAKQFQFSCPMPSPSTKGLTLLKEAFVEFQRSEQSQATQDLLKAAVNRENWENLVGYRASFANIPRWSTMNPSPTSPDVFELPNVGFSDTTVSISSNTPDSGSIIDISSISMSSGPVLDIQTGSALVGLAGQLGVNLTEEPFFEEDAYYVLLSNECGLNSLSRGTNWFLLPTGSPNQARIAVREASASQIAAQALGGFGSTFSTTANPNTLASTITYRANDQFIGSFQDMFNANTLQGNSLMGSNFNVATEGGLHGNLIAGFGGNLGIELWGLFVNFTKQTSSIQIKSQNNDALGIANSVAAQGVNYTALVVKERPAGAGLAPDGGPIYPVPPQNSETASFCPETALDILEGSVIEISTPWLNGDQAQNFANNLFTLVSNQTNSSATYTYSEGGHYMYPGMSFQGQIAHSIEFNYSDKGNQVTTITTGPKYYQSGSAGGDSRYIKRSETISKPGVVIGGDNESGTFSVSVDGLGIYQAINGQIDPIFSGDRVEVKVMNFPVER